MDLRPLPEDVIQHIGGFYITKRIKLQCRLDKLKKKADNINNRTIDEWIEHLKFSKRYPIKNIEILNNRIQFHNMRGDKCKCNKNELIQQGPIAHIRQMYLWYIQRIISLATPNPQYEGEQITNIEGKRLTAKYVEYGEEDDMYSIRTLVFVKDNN